MSQQVVTFSVQNQLFTFPKQALLACKNSFFEVLLHQSFPIDKDEQGNILLERNAQIFKFVAEFVLDSQALNKYKPYTEEFLNELFLEADFLQLELLKQFVSKQQQVLHLPVAQQLSYKHENTLSCATGVMFDLQPMQCDVQLEYFEIVTDNNDEAPLVYYKEQTWAIDTMEPTTWKKLSFMAQPVEHSDKKLRISFAQQPIVLKESTLYAFHMAYDGQGLIDYEDEVSSTAISNETMQLLPGRAVYYVPFAKEGTNTATFVGLIGYSLVK